MPDTIEYKRPATRDGFVALRDQLVAHWPGGYRLRTFEHIRDGGDGILRAVIQQTALAGPPNTAPPYRVAIAIAAGAGATDPSTVYTWTSDGWEPGSGEGPFPTVVTAMTTNDSMGTMPFFEAVQVSTETPVRMVYLMAEELAIAGP